MIEIRDLKGCMLKVEQWLFKNPTHALCFKIHIKTQSLFKTLECLRLLFYPTCFGRTLDHLQGVFLVQCCCPPCCFVTILLGYVAVSSICVVVTYTSLLSVLLCTDSIILWRWSSIWPKHVGWNNRHRHSNVLESYCVLMCILKHSAWVGF
jgi:hypothetical protein